MRSSYLLQVAVLATLSSVTGTLGQAIPSPSLSSSSQPLGSPSPTPTTVIRQGHPKQFLPENEDNWENGVDPHELPLVPSADINETDVQDYHQHRDIDLGDYNSLEEDDALVGDISPEGEDEEEEDDDSGDLHQHAVRATVDWNEYVQKGQELINELESAVKSKHSTDSKFNMFRAWRPDDKKTDSFPSEAGGAMDSDGIPHAQSQHYKYWVAQDPHSSSHYAGFFESGENPKAFVEKKVSKQGSPSLPLSEVSFQLLSWALDDGDESLHKLEYVYKPEIANPLTSGLMKQAYEKSCDQKDRIVYTPGDDEFKALLASPNDALVPRMLIDHADFFQKTVKEIRLYYHKNMIVFKIG